MKKQIKKSIKKEKTIKQHIINDSNSYCCGLNRNSNVLSAFFFEGIVYLNDSTEVNHSNMHLVCRNCLKLGDEKIFNELLNKKAIIEYKEQLPKSNRERLLYNQRKRLERIKLNSKKWDNVIYLGFNPIIPKPITNPALLLPLKTQTELDAIKSKPIKSKSKSIKKDSIINIESNIPLIDNDAGMVLIGDEGVAIIRGFNNDWQVVLLNESGKTESLTDWLEYNEAYQEALQLTDIKNPICVNQ